MEQRILGSSGLNVSALGLGCMGMSEFYGPSDEADCTATLHHALDKGMNFLDTADMYGSGHNEELIGRAITSRRDDVVLATKFGIVRDSGKPGTQISGRPEYIHQACDASLKRLGLDHIDLYYQHRVDNKVPIEDSVGAMAELVQAGKVRYLGLSEATSEQIRRAQGVHPIAALQTEYSLWSRDPEDDLLATCRDLNIAFVAYSPLGRGFLTATIDAPEALDESDFRRVSPRFMAGNIESNLDLTANLKKIADEKGCTPAQLSLAWVLAQGKDIIPIPGTRRQKYVDENLAALDIDLTADDLARLDAAFPVGAAAGERYG